uniref:IPT/TIG domain-containing protein n=1 Tax=Paractinoplanes polyasparticus TaxID=2856853 RepID=UPI001C849E4F|nr:IPT/TIG domain-containing protein [Actinoplanes polyasparticus]
MLRRVGRAWFASAAATVLVLGGTSVPAMAVTLPMTLSSVSGPSGGGGTIIGTVTATPAAPAPFPAGTEPVVQFQYVAASGATTCSATARGVIQIAAAPAGMTAGALTVDPATVTRISATKVAFKVPSSPYPVLNDDGTTSTINPRGLELVGSLTAAKWNVCVYDSASTTASSLLATASYTLAVRPTIKSIIPANGLAGGGQLITVTGAGFNTAAGAVTGSIGGVALTRITGAPNGNSFTAITGPRAAEAGLALIVNAPGGAVSSLDPDNNGQPEDADVSTNDAPIPFTYSNGITISPNTANAGAVVTVDVLGAGFSDLTFDAAGTPTDGNAHVFLVKDAYEAAGNRGVAECEAVTVIRDTELVCTLDLSATQLSPQNSLPASGPPAEGAYILTVVANGETTAGPAAKATLVTSGATFTIGPY